MAYPITSVIENVILNQPIPVGTGLPGLLVKVTGSLAEAKKKSEKEQQSLNKPFLETINMSVKEINEAIEKENVYFGIKETIKHKKNIKAVFIAKDTREETVKKLEDAGIEFSVLKTKLELAKNLNMDFFCEVFAIKK